MSFDPLIYAPPPIPTHGLLAIAAFLVGLGQFALPKGTALHVWTGRFWVAAMAYVAASSFFIHDLRVWGIWSPIHILSAITLLALVGAVAHARRGNIPAHARSIQVLFLLPLCVAGAFTFLPGRIMHAVITGS